MRTHDVDLGSLVNHTDNLICMHTHTHTYITCTSTCMHWYMYMYTLMVHTSHGCREPTSVPSSATTSTIRNASATTCTVLQAPQHKHFIVTKMAENSCGGRLLKTGFLVILQLKNSATKHDTRKLKYIQNRLMMSLLYIVERLPKNMMKILLL